MQQDELQTSRRAHTRNAAVCTEHMFWDIIQSIYKISHFQQTLLTTLQVLSSVVETADSRKTSVRQLKGLVTKKTNVLDRWLSVFWTQKIYLIGIEMRKHVFVG